MDKITTIATYSHPFQAEVDRQVLEQEGIRTFLADDNIVGANWLWSGAVGGVKLQVAESDVSRAAALLEAHREQQSEAEAAAAGGVTFPCEECGQIITLSADRCGGVETCPHCHKYVDVPGRPTSTSAPRSAVDRSRESSVRAGRTTRGLWFEVTAVFCLAVLPDLFAAVVSAGGGVSQECSFACQELFTIIRSLRVALPLLVILHLGRERLAQFGIVRFSWSGDIVSSVAIWFAAWMAWYVAVSMVPASVLAEAMSKPAYNWASPSGAGDILLLLAASLANGFAEEFVMRAYLITRLERLLGSTGLAVVVSTALFASYHIYQGWLALVGVAAVGLVYALVYCLQRRLWPVAIAHAIANFTALAWQ